MNVPEVDCQQRIYLSHFAFSILENDRWVFSNSDLSKVPFATILNNIIENYYKDTSINLIKKYKLLKENNPQINIEDLQKITLQDAKSIINKLTKNKNKNYLKNESEKFRLNVAVRDLLENLSMPEFITNEFPDINYSKYFVELLFEDYCRLPIHIREQIYYKNKYKDIDSCIQKQNKLQINVNGLTFIAFPMYITTDSFNNYNYLVCYSKRSRETNEEYKISSFRLSRIDKIEELDIEDEEKKQIQTCINKLLYKKDMSAPEFLNGEIIEIQVFLTSEGKNKYKSILHKRPHTYEVNGDIYHFKCTEFQAIAYFSKFGKDAVIVEPKTLKDKLCKFYLDAYENYIKTN